MYISPAFRIITILAITYQEITSIQDSSLQGQYEDSIQQQFYNNSGSDKRRFKIGKDEDDQKTLNFYDDYENDQHFQSKKNSEKEKTMVIVGGSLVAGTMLVIVGVASMYRRKKRQEKEHHDDHDSVSSDTPDMTAVEANEDVEIPALDRMGINKGVEACCTDETAQGHIGEGNSKSISAAEDTSMTALSPSSTRPQSETCETEPGPRTTTEDSTTLSTSTLETVS